MRYWFVRALSDTLADWLSKKLNRRFTPRLGSRSKESIMREYGVRVRIASWLGLFGFLSGLILFLAGYLSRYDWRAFGVSAALAAILPVLWMIGSSISGGRKKVRECLVAFSILQKFPLPVFYALFVLCVAGGVVSSISLILSPPQGGVEPTDDSVESKIGSDEVFDTELEGRPH